MQLRSSFSLNFHTLFCKNKIRRHDPKVMEKYVQKEMVRNSEECKIIPMQLRESKKSSNVRLPLVIFVL